MNNRSNTGMIHVWFAGICADHSVTHASLGTDIVCLFVVNTKFVYVVQNISETLTYNELNLFLYFINVFCTIADIKRQNCLANIVVFVRYKGLTLCSRCTGINHGDGLDNLSTPSLS